MKQIIKLNWLTTAALLLALPTAYFIPSCNALSLFTGRKFKLKIVVYVYAYILYMATGQSAASFFIYMF
jgi:hypothetical protein